MHAPALEVAALPLPPLFSTRNSSRLTGRPTNSSLSQQQLDRVGVGVASSSGGFDFNEALLTLR